MKEKIKSKLVIEIEKKIEQLILANGFEIVDINSVGGKNKHLMVSLYNNRNCGIDDLAKINRLIRPILESIPVLGNDFTLEVSSPGIYRDFRYIKEFNIFKGRKIKILTEKNVVLYATCLGLKDDYLVFLDDSDDKEIKNIKINEIKSANLNG